MALPCCTETLGEGGSNSQDYRISETLPWSSRCSFNNHLMHTTKMRHSKVALIMYSFLRHQKVCGNCSYWESPPAQRSSPVTNCTQCWDTVQEEQQSHQWSSLLISQLSIHCNPNSLNLPGSNRFIKGAISAANSFARDTIGKCRF